MSGPGTIRIVGLGPGGPGLRTLAAQRCLDEAETIVLRTAIHPGLGDLTCDPRVQTCDDEYETGTSFDDVYRRIVKRVLQAAARGDVVYAVPGHPLFGERTVALITEAAASTGIEAEVIAGVSAIDAVAGALRVDPMAAQAQCLDALQMEPPTSRIGSLAVNPYRPLLISQVYAPRIASLVKLALAEHFPEDHPITVIRAAGVPGEERVAICPLHQLDHQVVDHLTSVWVPALEPLSAPREWDTLVALVDRLRAPDGCPWDRAQTHESLRNAVLDEAYEVADAIDNGDMENLAEELGDLLLVVTMQAQIADEVDAFSIQDSLESVNTKLVRRHPHVFGEISLKSPDEVLRAWRDIKAAERQARGELPKSDDPVDRLPRSMPALLKAQAVLKEHPVTHGCGHDQGSRLLSLVNEIVAAGENPASVLLDALKHHVAKESTRSVE